MTAARKIRIGMVGGGPGAGIAGAHRTGMRIDDRFELAAGVFSRDRQKSREQGLALGVDPRRIYDSHEQMAVKEKGLDGGIEAVSIVTPSDSHYRIAKEFVERGFHVICDKPLCNELGQARSLAGLVDDSGVIFMLTFNYSCYAMIREAAARVRRGDLGGLRAVHAEFAQCWGLPPDDSGLNRQLAWRMDPRQSGEESMLLDLGTHAHHLLRYVTGQEVTAVCAEMRRTEKGRGIFDDAQLLMRLDKGASGMMWVSIVATGQEHGLRLRVVGEKMSLEWRHEDAQRLTLRHPGGGVEILACGQPGLSPECVGMTRLELGHPEGFFESFANAYALFADAVLELARGSDRSCDMRYPTVHDGVAGLRFVQAAKHSHARGGVWTQM